MRLSILILLPVLLFPQKLSRHPDEELLPRLACRLCANKPIIDGVLDEDCWRKAESATGFLLLDHRGMATQQTRCMVSYDKKNLYIGFICLESDLKGIRKSCRIRDGDLSWEDCVEVFLDVHHTHSTYFHIMTNILGTRFDETGAAGRPYPDPASWNAEWKVATAVIPGGWSVEIALPFVSMGLSAPKAGTIWGFNAHRQEYRLIERSSWSETERSFHEPANFGHLLFLPPL
jgi:cellulose/xylan binding protein with CBM9 domain